MILDSFEASIPGQEHIHLVLEGGVGGLHISGACRFDIDQQLLRVGPGITANSNGDGEYEDGDGDVNYCDNDDLRL